MTSVKQLVRVKVSFNMPCHQCPNCTFYYKLYVVEYLQLKSTLFAKPDYNMSQNICIAKNYMTIRKLCEKNLFVEEKKNLLHLQLEYRTSSYHLLFHGSLLLSLVRTPCLWKSDGLAAKGSSGTFPLAGLFVHARNFSFVEDLWMV